THALSGFRLKTLVAKFPFPDGAIQDVRAHYVHFVDLDPSCDAQALFAAAEADHTPALSESHDPTTSEGAW
ncbi:hypothetical protein H4R19_007352, partial [Coemansia spiralis]